ncbi:MULTISPECIES: hypothetical protein [Photorhabdus]|uniref:Uncharacterized protein n=1 Tax=Photorhabdus asymbiotica TaxID=291112 RepID=A0ABX9SU20_9GAMM|nr:hypothetical protein [Photorhabdus asymbiotica]RKS66919.1 hypothetical protein BDD30_1267 [Photorhabdus asymbiotica]
MNRPNSPIVKQQNLELKKDVINNHLKKFKDIGITIIKTNKLPKHPENEVIILQYPHNLTDLENSDLDTVKQTILQDICKEIGDNATVRTENLDSIIVEF